MDNDIESFVEAMYANGKKPCERFGITHKELSEIEGLFFKPHGDFEEMFGHKKEQVIALPKTSVNPNPNRNDINVYRSINSGAKYGMKLE